MPLLHRAGVELDENLTRLLRLLLDLVNSETEVGVVGDCSGVGCTTSGRVSISAPEMET